MLYKPVFFGYVAAAMIVVASLVLILIMFRQSPKYERTKLRAIIGLLNGSLIMNTLYFLSFFDSLTNLTTVYAAVERGLDITCSYVINLFLFLFLHHVASDGSERFSLFRRLLWPVLAVLTAVFLFAAVVYITAVTDEYHVAGGNILLAETTQIILTAVICAVTAFYAFAAARNVHRHRSLYVLILAAGLVNIITALYNGVESISMFREEDDYLSWSGINDYNTWLFILSDLLFLLIIIWYYRRQPTVQLSAQPAADNAAPAEIEVRIPEELAFTQREKEIVLRILDRCTYEEIAEELSISKYTVKRHVHNIYEKAGVSRRDDLIRLLKDNR